MAKPEMGSGQDNTVLRENSTKHLKKQPHHATYRRNQKLKAHEEANNSR
jgi:hypothetical protein